MKNLSTGNAYSVFIQQYEGPESLPLLSQEEERALLAIVKAAGPHSPTGAQAIDKLIRHNVKFVAGRAKRWQRYTAGDEAFITDLCQAGVAGLWWSIIAFDLSSEVRLLSYAVHKIDQQIREE